MDFFGEIEQIDFASILDESPGDANLLTGVHGDIDGFTDAEGQFLAEDTTVWGGNPRVNIIDVSNSSDADISDILNGPGTTVCGFCHSSSYVARLLSNP